MKNTTLNLLAASCFLGALLTAFSASAQDAKQARQITQHYDKVKLEQLRQEFEAENKRQKAAAIAAAKVNGWPIQRPNPNGGYDELMALSPDGKPIYYVLDNVNAAKSTRANHLHTGGTLGLNLNGQGMFSGVWDGGSVRTTHQEFGGRMTVFDGNTAIDDNSYHATHVTGTVGASGVQANAKGMAPQSTVHTYDWTNDTAEVIAEAENGLLLSNHSYGIPIDSAPGNWFMGAYSGASRSWDQIAYAAPYYLMVASAGNDGNTPNPAPMTNTYDKLTGNKTSKNNLVVANCQDANVDAQGNLISVSINSSSSEGPADDRRVKPDITGNGTTLTSSVSTSNSSYASLTGTSMASPNVMGTLVLLQQHYNNVNGRFMKAATLKALACHTADDKGKVGPDPVWGWGLLNAKKAAQAISQNGLQSWISEETLRQGETFTFTATSDGVTPLLASICWTDVPGTANNGTLNDETPALVNDLDIRITQNGNTFYPWRLQSNANLAALRDGDNLVDNVERINIDAPAGTYTITVTHKGTLQNGPQDFAFVVTGLSSAIALAQVTTEQSACLDGSAAYDFNFTNAGTATTNLSAQGLPNGATATFTPATLTASGAFTVTISNLQNAVPGVYPVSIVANNGTETESRTVTLNVLSTQFTPVNTTFPAQGQTGVATQVLLQWDAVPSATGYHVQVSDAADFSNIVAQGQTDTPQYTANLAQGTDYFWRVFPNNVCGEATTADGHTFQTGQLVCDRHFEPADYSNGIINNLGSGLAIIQIPVDGDFTVGDVNVTLGITHSRLQDITVELEGPYEIGLPLAKLLVEPCGTGQNISCVMDDAGSALNCNAAAPTITGSVIPFEPLSFFNNRAANGVWTLYVRDPHVGEGGSVDFVGLDFCTVQPLLGVKQEEALSFSVFPNPTKGLLNIRLAQSSGQATVELFDLQGRLVQSKKMHGETDSLSLDGLQDGVYLVSVTDATRKTTKKIVLNR